jgi:hypothetical protein
MNREQAERFAGIINATGTPIRAAAGRTNLGDRWGVTGPYRILYTSVEAMYPERIDWLCILVREGVLEKSHFSPNFVRNHWDELTPQPQDSVPDQRPEPLSEITVTLDRTSAALVCGELLILVRAFEPLDGQYSARLQAVCDTVALAVGR